MPSVIYGLAAICGSVMLAVAYYMAIQGIAWTKVSMMGLTLLLGIVWYDAAFLWDTCADCFDC